MSVSHTKKLFALTVSNYYVTLLFNDFIFSKKRRNWKYDLTDKGYVAWKSTMHISFPFPHRCTSLGGRKKMTVFGQKIDVILAKINHMNFICKYCILLDDYIYYSIDEYYWPLQFNLTSWSLFSRYIKAYQSIIHLRWILRRINNLLLHIISVLDYWLFYFQVNDAC